MSPVPVQHAPPVNPPRALGHTSDNEIDACMMPGTCKVPGAPFELAPRSPQHNNLPKAPGTPLDPPWALGHVNVSLIDVFTMPGTRQAPGTAPFNHTRCNHTHVPRPSQCNNLPNAPADPPWVPGHPSDNVIDAGTAPGTCQAPGDVPLKSAPRPPRCNNLPNALVDPPRAPGHVNDPCNACTTTGTNWVPSDMLLGQALALLQPQRHAPTTTAGHCPTPPSAPRCIG